MTNLSKCNLKAKYVDIKQSGELSQKQLITANDLSVTHTFAIKSIYDAHYSGAFSKLGFSRILVCEK